MNYTPTPGKLYFTDSEKNKAMSILSDAKDNWEKKNNTKFRAIIFFESTSTKIDDSFF